MEKPDKKRLHPINYEPLYFLLGLLLCLLIYEIIALSTREVFLPEFFKGLTVMFQKLSIPNTWKSLGFSLLRLFISLFISGILGVSLGLTAGYYTKLSKILNPLMTILRAYPTIALVMLLAVYVPNFGIYVVSVVIFPLFYQAALEGSKQAYDKFYYELALKGRGHFFSNTFRVIIPLSSPYILLGFIQGLGLGWKAEIMSETFAADSTYLGIGKLIYSNYQAVEYENMMAYVLIAILTSLILDDCLYLIKGLIEKKLGLTKKDKIVSE